MPLETRGCPAAVRSLVAGGSETAAERPPPRLVPALSLAILCCAALQTLKERQAALKAQREAAKACSLAVNAAKASIDALSAELQDKSAQHGGAAPGGVLDSEQFQLMQRLKGIKLDYRR